MVITGYPAARKGDRFKCTGEDPELHIGGEVVGGTGKVVIGGKDAARLHDATLCKGEGFDISGLDASAGAGDATADDAEADWCAAQWKKLQEEAEKLIEPAGDDHRERNHIINGAYADLYRRQPKFVWAGLAAYASKQVGCAMDHAVHVIDSPLYTPPSKGFAAFTYSKLGEGNRDLFLDVYPLHRFYEKFGWASFERCASHRVPPVPPAAMDGFRALHNGDAEKHLRAIAYHEQLNILQRDIYNDNAMRFTLDNNELAVSPLVGGKPADLVLTSECTDDSPGEKNTFKFKKDGRDELYNTDQRMEWILDDVGGPYMDKEGSAEHKADLDRLLQRGRDHGGRYP